MTWDVEVGRAGEFEAAVYYTCPAADVGSTIELSFLDSRIHAKVTPAWDPPQLGRAFDRVERSGESYWKDFRPLRLGRIRLNQGRAKLTLRALDVKGKQVADVRYVALTRL